MIRIDWDKFKVFKHNGKKEGDNFSILLNFLITQHNMTDPRELYDTLSNDGLAVMMLDKNNIKDFFAFEAYLYKQK